MVSPSHLLPFLSSTTLWLDAVSNPSIHEDICQHTSIFYMVPTSLLSFQGSSCSPTPLAPWFSLLSHWWRKLKLTLSLLFLILIHGIICAEDLFFFYCPPWYPICQSCHVMSCQWLMFLVLSPRHILRVEFFLEFGLIYQGARDPPGLRGEKVGGVPQWSQKLFLTQKHDKYDSSDMRLISWTHLCIP